MTAPTQRFMPDRMREEDLPRVVEIERACFSDPWSAASFLYEIRDNPLAVNLTLRDRTDGTLAAYACLWILDGELHINNVAVDSSFRRLGLGRQLMEEAIAEGSRRDCGKALLQVRPTNDAALALYRSLGFVATGRRRRYYSDTGEDAILMEKAMGSPGDEGAGAPPGC